MNRYYKSLARQVGHFYGSLVAGSLMFLGLLAVTVLVDMASAALASQVTDSYISHGLKWVGRILFTTDVMLLVWWLVYSFISTIKGRRGGHGR